MTISIYEHLSEDIVSLAVTLFYDRVLRDDRVNYFFAGAELSVLLDHQTRFLTVAFGGQNRYHGRSLSEVHRPLVENMGLSEVHFDIIVAHLKITFEELSVKEDLIQEIVATVSSLKNQVLCKV